MQFLSKSLAAVAGFVILCSASVSAQYKLPQSHDKQHSELLASQKPMAADIKVTNVLRYISELQKTALPDEDEVFGDYWVNTGVNPYAGAVIPETMDIDVSGYVHPISGTRVSSNFGYRPRFGRIHRGIDLSLSVGDTVRAAFDGKVRLTQFERRGYGYYVIVRHTNGIETVYGHLSKFLVKPNQTVKAGDPIALGGNTGRSTGPHLHFETRYLGLAINPATIIDFENKVTIKDTFTFDKQSVEKSNVRKYAKKSKARKRKATASSRKKSSRKK